MDVILITLDMHLRTTLNKILTFQTITCKAFEQFTKIKPLIDNNSESIIFLDDRFQGSLEILYYLVENFPKNKIVLLVSSDKVKPAIISEGQLIFATRPIDNSILKILKTKVSDKVVLQKDALDDILIGSSEAIIKIKKIIRKLSQTDYNIFLYGDTGTGKDIIARAIHNLRFPTKEIITANCSLLEGQLMDSLLFGHTKGSFTGAYENQIGLIEKAKNSTLFLDEIEEFSKNGQAKLLRLLENGEYRVVGDPKLRYTKFSLITASNIDYKELLTTKLLRKDFFHRISNIKIYIPPLRERIEDIPQLTYYYEKKQGYTDYIAEFDNLFTYSWPGNVRELFSVIDRVHFYNSKQLIPTTELIET